MTTAPRDEWTMGTCTRCDARDYVIRMKRFSRLFCLDCFEATGEDAKLFKPAPLTSERLTHVFRNP